ncbi:MAG: universal stress protein [Solirubrobacterales bacterium]|nr:universal stress protein [Solirubrobacterales bacterium]
MYRSILVAVDLGESSRDALKEAGELAVALNAHLTVLSVVPPLPAYASTAGVDIGALERDAQQEAQRVVNQAVHAVPENVAAHGIIRLGQAGSEIVAQIEEGGHDLVVLGSRGRGRVAAGLLGSVVGDVHFATKVSLLVVQPIDDAR